MMKYKFTYLSIRKTILMIGMISLILFRLTKHKQTQNGTTKQMSVRVPPLL